MDRAIAKLEEHMMNTIVMAPVKAHGPGVPPPEDPVPGDDQDDTEEGTEVEPEGELLEV